MNRYKSLLKEKKFQEDKQHYIVDGWSAVLSFGGLFLFLSFSSTYFSKISFLFKKWFTFQKTDNFLLKIDSFSWLDLIFLMTPIFLVWVLVLCFQNIAKGFNFRSKIFKKMRASKLIKYESGSFITQTFLILIFMILFLNYLFSLDIGLIPAQPLEKNLMLLQNTTLILLGGFFTISLISTTLEQILSYRNHQKQLLIGSYELKREMKELGQCQDVKKKARGLL